MVDASAVSLLSMTPGDRHPVRRVGVMLVLPVALIAVAVFLTAKWSATRR